MEDIGSRQRELRVSALLLSFLTRYCLAGATNFESIQKPNTIMLCVKAKVVPGGVMKINKKYLMIIRIMSCWKVIIIWLEYLVEYLGKKHPVEALSRLKKLR